MLACILTVIGTTTLTSCTKEDNPADLQKKVVGKWFAEYAKTGSVPDFYGNPQTFVKMVQFYEFNADGTGCWVAFAIDAEGKAIEEGISSATNARKLGAPAALLGAANT